MFRVHFNKYFLFHEHRIPKSNSIESFKIYFNLIISQYGLDSGIKTQNESNPLNFFIAK